MFISIFLLATHFYIVKWNWKRSMEQAFAFRKKKEKKRESEKISKEIEKMRAGGCMWVRLEWILKYLRWRGFSSDFCEMSRNVMKKKNRISSALCITAHTSYSTERICENMCQKLRLYSILFSLTIIYFSSRFKSKSN